jgi:hypothetical protein
MMMMMIIIITIIIIMLLLQAECFKTISSTADGIVRIISKNLL